MPGEISQSKKDTYSDTERKKKKIHTHAEFKEQNKQTKGKKMAN